MSKYSEYRGNDLLELLLHISNMDFKYRNDIVYNDDITYGIEIEYENVPKYIVNRYINKNYKKWITVNDCSLDIGGEIVSPIIHGNINDWDEIESISDYLKNKNVNTIDNVGFHIHIGRQVFKAKEELLLFIKLYILYEHVIFRFAYGDKPYARKKINEYAAPIGLELYNMLNELEKLSLEEIYNKLSKLSRYRSINFTNINSSTIKKTIEFRLFNASSSKTIIQNDINSTINLCNINSNIDKEMINYEISKFENKSNYLYNNLDIKSSLQYVDYIFKEDIDKDYFLKQYIKKNETIYGIKNSKIINK